MRVPEGVRSARAHRAARHREIGTAAASTDRDRGHQPDHVETRFLGRARRHDADLVLASSAADYIYDDFSGPAPLDLEGTRALLRNFLSLVLDFRISSEPTRFAAGDNVITESVEQMTFRDRAVTLHGLDVKHFTDGKVDREWQYANGAEVLTELLGLPPPTLPDVHSGRRHGERPVSFVYA